MFLLLFPPIPPALEIEFPQQNKGAKAYDWRAKVLVCYQALCAKQRASGWKGALDVRTGQLCWQVRTGD